MMDQKEAVAFVRHSSETANYRRFAERPRATRHSTAATAHNSSMSAQPNIPLSCTGARSGVESCWDSWNHDAAIFLLHRVHFVEFYNGKLTATIAASAALIPYNALRHVLVLVMLCAVPLLIVTAAKSDPGLFGAPYEQGPRILHTTVRDPQNDENMAKQDESAMRFTSFHVPVASVHPNPKHVGTTYMKSDSQTLWARNAVRAGKSKPAGEDSGAATPSEGRRGSKVIVIHPGSRWLRIGRASDVTPLSIPNVVARKHKPPVPPVTYMAGISRPAKGRERGQTCTVAQPSDEYAIAPASDDPFDSKVAAIQVSLRDRMRFYKLRVTANAVSAASAFNEQFKPETIPEANDPFHIDWITKTPEEDVIVGEKALNLSDPQELGYVLKWPFYGGTFNTRDYPSNQLILSDIEAIIRETLREKFSIPERSFKEYSVVLVIPDFYDRAYVQHMESLAATYGAGISNGCVVDMGAVTTSIACVDDGLVIHDTRISLNMGGDDISEFLYILLQKINFPYRELDLARSYDWKVIEDLKAKICTLAEGDVALNLYDFVVRRPGKPTEKYGLRAYDETILAPMCLFEPRVIEFEQKRAGARPFCPAEVTDEIVEQTADHVVSFLDSSCAPYAAWI
ncbi:hypothetical protein NM688_g8848 [Phlebia brevispora]|uniref:Uncharacterized protein n=1 Tax=Phlebia brevispora TaxID=194682 RepID=A0ACC1RMY8_9APHY|nr:hypothetical protein NM688_g8848 [Phlebia brevispora]